MHAWFIVTLTTFLAPEQRCPPKGWRLSNSSQPLKLSQSKRDRRWSGSKKARSCALVFSSGALLRHESGRVIDSHEVVVRFNMAPTMGFERYIGGKTTHMVLSKRCEHYGAFMHAAHHDAKYHRDATVAVVLASCERRDNRSTACVENLIRTKGEEASHNARGIMSPGYFANGLTADDRERIVIYSSRASKCFDSVLRTAYEISGCTNGMEALFWTMDICESISIFGATEDVPPGYPWHYFDETKNASAFQHDPAVIRGTGLLSTVNNGPHGDTKRKQSHNKPFKPRLRHDVALEHLWLKQHGESPKRPGDPMRLRPNP